jgi:hypothetical protein
MQTTKLGNSNSVSQKHYRGFAHCHSNYSYDGKYTYSELKELFLKENLDFVCITEHIEYLDQTQIDTIIDDCRANSDDQFLFIPGIEIDDFVIYFIGINHVKVDFTSSRTIFDSLLPVASLCVFSHPIKAKYKYPQWLIDLCDGVEIWNTKHDGIHYPRIQSLNLLKHVKQSRPHAISLVGMDFHNQRHLSPANIQLSNTGPLTEDFVLNEIKQGNFSVCKGTIDIDSVSALGKQIFWLRIALMDMTHSFHLSLSKKGIVFPKSIKRIVRKLMEGK